MKSVIDIKTACKSLLFRLAVSRWMVRFTAIMITLVLAPSCLVQADMREERPVWTMGFEGFFSSIDGRMGFDQQNAGYGTLNDLRQDLGLPWDNYSYRIVASIRPLQHHLLRAYGSIPETYQGETLLTRQLRTTRYPSAVTNNAQVTNDQTIAFRVGDRVKSMLKTAMFGFGYDLDFLLWPNWIGGFNGDLRYLDLRVQMSGTGYIIPSFDPAAPDDRYILPNTFDVISIDELVPCLGAHTEIVFPCDFACGSGSSAGAFSRLVYGITPNYLNYVDVSAGLTLNMAPSCRFTLNARVGYEHESIFHDAQNRNGRVLELKRDGIMFRMEGLF